MMKLFNHNRIKKGSKKGFFQKKVSNRYHIELLPYQECSKYKENWDLVASSSSNKKGVFGRYDRDPSLYLLALFFDIPYIPDILQKFRYHTGITGYHQIWRCFPRSCQLHFFRLRASDASRF